MAAPQIQAVLERDVDAMTAEVHLAFHFAETIIVSSPLADAAREAVASQWGEKGVIDLTLATQIGRVFPMVKRGLGFARSCRRVDLDGLIVDAAERIP